MWHEFISLVKHTRLDDVGRGMLSSPLESIQDQTTSGVACYHRPWTKYMIGQRKAWNASMAFGRYIWWHDVGRCMQLSPL